MQTSRTLFPIDAKLLQYYYSSVKVELLLSQVLKIKETLKTDHDIIYDPQSIMLLSGTIFNVNDNFYRRSELLQNCLKYNASQSIDVPLILSPISFDSLENISRNAPIGPYGISLDKQVPLPNRKKVVDTIVLLELLLINVNNVIMKRFDAALNQYNKQHATNETKETLSKKLVTLDFNELDIIEQLAFHDIPIIDIKHQESILKFYLINQFRFLEMKLSIFQNIVDKLSTNIRQSITSITKSTNTSQSSNITPLYSMYLSLIRVADLYVEIRKSGKSIYFQNIQYFTPYMRHRKELREILTQMSFHFAQSKQNSMILTLISKYAKRSEIKNLSMDSNIFVSEFRKTSLDMITLISKMLAVLKRFHNEWTEICVEGKSNDFNKEYLREKLKERAATEKAKRLSIMAENQKQLKAQLSHRMSSSSIVNNPSQNKTLQSSSRRVASMGQIDENTTSSPAASPMTSPTTATASSTVIQRKNSLSMRRPASVIGTPGTVSQPASSLSSLTGSSRSPFYRPQPAGSTSATASRSNSLTRTDNARGLVIKKKSISDMAMGNDEFDEFAEPPKIGQIQRRSSNGSITESPSRTGVIRSPSIRSTPSSNSSRTNSLTSSPSVMRNRQQMLQRRASVNLSSPSSAISTSNSNSSSGSNSSPRVTAVNASNVSLQRRRSVIGTTNLQSQLEKERTDHIRAAALASKSVGNFHLTAQQRLQQHIMKSSQKGTMYSKPLETVKMTTKSEDEKEKEEEVEKVREKAQDKESLGSSDVEDTIVVKETKNEHILANGHPEIKFEENIDDKLSAEIEKLALGDGPDLKIVQPTPTKTKEIATDDIVKVESLTEFPSSPLNSIKSKSLEAQNALKIQLANRSRSNSNQSPNAKQPNINNNKRTILSPLRNGTNGDLSSKNAGSINGSPSRSRSNSATMNSANKNGTLSLSSPLSRSNSVSLSRTGSRSRSASISRRNSVIGNIVVVPEHEVSRIDEDQESSVVKKVRFTGVPEYTEDEDAQTPQHFQKQIKQKWAGYKPLFRKINSQEGEVFKQNHFEGHEQVVIDDYTYTPPPPPMRQYNMAMMQSQQPVPRTTLRPPPVTSTGNISTPNESSGSNRLSRLFRRR
ncbi:hypothetical protein DAPK24_026930 [Pichia kluyveri]|uniref:GLC7-interacting protein 4 n=1 Tax=Pichia kluyveri TaxID=36015 RepID=A0AAV5R4K2_PICKL|nr:hypothetical protein DAPK24_026930 [Pichia kluyveri]